MKPTQPKNCETCEKEIPLKRLELIPSTSQCVQCKSTSDDFKWKMKTVGFNQHPTIAKDEQSWNLLKKQKQVRDI